MAKTCFAIVVAAGLAIGAWGQQPQQPQAKSKKELDAFMAVRNAPDPDSRIKAAEDLLHKYADTQFKDLALQMETMAYQQKNDFDNMLIAGERTLEVNPDNVGVLITLAAAIPQRTREHDLDKDEKLSKAEKYATRAQTVIPNIAKPNPQITDDEWTGYKKSAMSQVHEALGRIAFARKNFPAAEKSFQTALELAPQPDAMVLYQLGLTYAAETKYDEAIGAFDRSMALGGVKVGNRDLAAEKKAAAVKAKLAGASKPAAPAGQEPPPQGEPKRP
ncbi:MAG: tetratricopeptide repeat protein [Acidobacteria bacterium]|nr:tetratricopeptide repeat protein [Acidobacteriota bacterium]